MARSDSIVIKADALDLPAIYRETLATLCAENFAQQRTHGHTTVRPPVTYRQFKYAQDRLAPTRRAIDAERTPRTTLETIDQALDKEAP